LFIEAAALFQKRVFGLSRYDLASAIGQREWLFLDE
jgi:hypothetical protein